MSKCCQAGIWVDRLAESRKLPLTGTQTLRGPCRRNINSFTHLSTPEKLWELPNHVHITTRCVVFLLSVLRRHPHALRAGRSKEQFIIEGLMWAVNLEIYSLRHFPIFCKTLCVHIIICRHVSILEFMSCKQCRLWSCEQIVEVRSFICFSILLMAQNRARLCLVRTVLLGNCRIAVSARVSFLIHRRSSKVLSVYQPCIILIL